ncbi:ABC-type sugar transport system, periplasmic component [Hahella chejuensis KCTC 2396]|uniref:ABC-type sugar transport system, periplasmic component n=1 Tax=Hahella chejuensis (strain KCTC 2396) TaxID=349521 RepID=Q2SMS8_HAHCH|nr:LacI family DNA-binding transcriptional regulator [Hahella chejuensis]ABC28046.1 ABC-type sugar transport system, periplasmic component [Hahella chejuensis KCTC 2396]
MSKRPTITDLAQAAGVSPATVDRVLNNRSKVREATAQRVLLAAEDIGYHASGLLKKRFQESKPHKTIALLLQRSAEAFYQTLGVALVNAASRQRDYQIQTQLIFMDEVSPAYISSQLQQAAETSDAIALVALDHHSINQVIEQLANQGIPVITLLSQLSTQACAGHLGLDSRKAGRSAAWAISRLAKTEGEVGILLGSHRYLNQEISEISFISYFRELGRSFRLLDPILNLDDDRLAAEATAQLLASHPDLTALYSAGGGMAGMISALRSEAADRKLIVICNELTPSTRDALNEGLVDMVIATPVERLAAEAIALFVRAFNDKGEPRFAPVLLAPELHIRENI